MLQKFKSYSQIAQDKFVLNFFENKSGYFLDLGCGDGFSEPCGNNTLLLENCGWDGLGVDFNQSYIKNFLLNRKSKAVCADLTKTKLKEILQNNNCPMIIDFLSFDVDQATESVLNSFPSQDYKFKLIAFEHNLYLGNSSIYCGLKEKAKKVFGDEYEILIEDVKLENHGAVEDWYVNKELTCSLKKVYLKDLYPNEILKAYEIWN